MDKLHNLKVSKELKEKIGEGNRSLWQTPCYVFGEQCGKNLFGYDF